MKLTQNDLTKLKTLHPDLVKVVEQCALIYPGTFRVQETDRSVAQQQKNLAKGVSQTSNSRHVRANNKNGYACAVDLVVLIGNTVTWKSPPYYELAKYMKQSAQMVKIKMEWGGDWKTLKDLDHFQLPWKIYP